jgi:hypothetical protein
MPLPGIGRTRLFPGSAGFEGVTTYGPTAFDTTNNRASTNIRTVVQATAISTSGTQVRLTLRSGSAGALTITDCYIGELAGAGDAYDAVSMTAVTWNGGSAGFSGLAANTDKVSDIIDFVIDETKGYVVAFHVGASDNNVARDNTGAVGAASYFKDGASESATGNVTGYSAFGSGSTVDGLKLIEV